MSDTDAGSEPTDAPDEELEAGVEAGIEAGVDAEAEAADKTSGAAADDAVDAPPDEVGRRELTVLRARKTLEEEAEAARRRVLGPRRGRLGPATLTAAPPADDDVDTSERLRELVRGVEEETDRLQEDVSRLRSAAGRAGATLQEEVQRAAEELAQGAVEELETSAGETVEALTAAVATLQETAAGLQQAVGQLSAVAPVVQQLAELAAAPPAIPEALGGIITDLTEQLAALGEAVSVQVRTSVEEALAAELGRHEARIEHALARLVDELARLRRRMPVSKRGAAIDLTKDQLTGIGEAVGDYLLEAMREKKS